MAKAARSRAIDERTPDIEPPAPYNRLLAERRLAPADAVDRLRVLANLAESPLAWLVRRGHVGPRQFEAGERLRGDFLRAAIAPRVTMRWDAAPADGRGRAGTEARDPTTAQIHARSRFDAAVAAVGAGLGDVLWRVVCLGEGLETAERAMGWPSRAGKVVLGLALDRLADHYDAGSGRAARANRGQAASAVRQAAVRVSGAPAAKT